MLSKAKLVEKIRIEAIYLVGKKIVASNAIMLEQNLMARKDKNRKQTFEGACKS